MDSKLIFLLVLILINGSVSAENINNSSDGSKIFKKCKTCHQVGTGAKNRLGPQLNNLFGRPAGELPGFKYSNSMQQAGRNGLVWNSETLNAFIENPKKYIPKIRMNFRGLKQRDDRKNLLIYLSGFSQENDEYAKFSDDNSLSIDPSILSIEGDPEYGEYLSSECVTCHQTNGENDGIPVINAWPVKEFVVVMHAYKQKQRSHPVMQMVARRLSSEEIAALAAYFKDLN